MKIINENNFCKVSDKLIKSQRDVSFAYLYEIFLPQGEVLLLSSKDKDIIGENKIFLPFSEINLEKGRFNDSAENVIILYGIFDQRAISKTMNLLGCKIKIYFYLDSVITPLVNYFITEFEKNDLDFRLKCQPEATKYNQSLLLLFSKTCRANFGDKKCGINIDQYKKTYRISDIESCFITLLDMDEGDGYYDLGQVFFVDRSEREVSYRIVAHYKNKITVEREIDKNLLDQEEAILLVACDKNFITCCNKFNNAVNFRGEPTIDQHNF